MVAKVLFFISILFFTVSAFGQTYKFEVHPNGRVASVVTDDVIYDLLASANNRVIQELKDEIYKRFNDDFNFVIVALNHGGLNLGGKSVGGIYFGKNYVNKDTVRAVIFSNGKNSINGVVYHEIMHAWANHHIYTEKVIGEGENITSVQDYSHWGMTGGSSTGWLGGFIQSSLVDYGNNSYRVKLNDFKGSYNDLELYLMGLIPVGEVAPFDVFTQITSYRRASIKYSYFTAMERTTYTPAKLDSIFGLPVPSPDTLPKKFKSLILILSQSPLTDEDWAVADEKAKWFEFQGDNGNPFYDTFWEITNGKAKMDAGDLFKSMPFHSFKVTTNGFDKVHLEWFAEPGFDHQKFIVYRVTENEQRWWPITEINTRDAPNTGGIYETYDLNPESGTNIYKVKQIDITGKVKWSNKETVAVFKDDFKIYPVPARNTLTIEWKEGLVIDNVKIHNIMGEMVYSQATIDDISTRLEINTSNFSQGVYLISLFGKQGGTKTEKVFISP